MSDDQKKSDSTFEKTRALGGTAPPAAPAQPAPALDATRAPSAAALERAHTAAAAGVSRSTPGAGAAPVGTFDKTRAPSGIGREAPIDTVEPGAPVGAAAAVTPVPVGTALLSKKPRTQSGAAGAAGGGEGDRVVGQVLGGYDVLRKLAEGGMGVVYEGRHAKLGRRGAIKLLKLEYCQSDDVVERFYQEARAVNEIHHENIVDIYDFGRDADGRVFFVMEFLEGESLAGRLKRGPMPFGEAMPVLEQIIRALKAAHDKGFVHRDLKPDNIWLKRRDDGATDVRLLDFGIAKLVGLDGAKEKLTRTGTIIGTPDYMSPEQINGAPTVDARTDVYSLGIIMYELFAGHVPFQGETLAAIMTGHLFTDPPPLTGLPQELGIPDAVATIVDRMLAKEAADRYQNVSEVLADLRAVAQNREPSVVITMNRERPKTATGMSRVPRRAETEPVPRSPAPTRSKLTVPLAATAAVGLGLVGYLALGRSSKAPSATPPAPIGSTPTKPAKDPGPPIEPAVDYQKVRKDAQTLLRESLAHAEPKVRVHGTDGVGTTKDRESENKLLELVGGDPDAEVRGHAARALGLLGVAAARETMVKLEVVASPPLKVWYAAALVRLGDKDARKRLVKYTKEKDLAVAFKAALALADVSTSGDKDAIGALTALAAREAELNDIAPYAGAVLLGELASLRHERARTVLYTILEDKNERARLAAAEGLARLGDEAALEPLKKTLDDPASSNRLVAAVALVPLGDYSGYDVLTEKLADQDPEVRRLAARGLGEIGEKKSVRALLPLLGDGEWTVRVASAVALVTIVGLDPKLLAQASVDWAKGALDSEDWAVRKAAAGVLGDMPEEAAVPLLARAILDPDPQVRRAAAKSAGKLKSPAAAQSVATAALAEKDPEVRADQVRALGAIAEPSTKPALVELAKDQGPVGVLASGSLIAVGDDSAKARLETAVADRRVDVRKAAVEASVLAKNPVVVPTLTTGAKDRVFDVRFGAALGLATYRAERALSVAVLQEGLRQRDVGLQAQAKAALLGLGETPAGGASPEQMLDSADPAVRQAAMPVIAALPWAEARPLVRRVLADPDAGVRSAGLDLVEKHADDQRPDARKLYKSVLDDADAAVRAKAQARMAKVAEPLDPTASNSNPAPVVPPPPDTKLLDDASAEVSAAVDEAKMASAELERVVKQLEGALAVPADDDDDIKKVKDLAGAARTLRGRIEAARDRAAAAAGKLDDAAKNTPVVGAKEKAAAAKQVAAEAASLAMAASKLADDAVTKADDYAKSEASDVPMLLSAADTQIATGKLADAKRDLDKAARAAKKDGKSYPTMSFSYGRLYDKMAQQANGPGERLGLLKKAKQSFDAFVKTGSGPKVAQARERSEELGEEIAELEGATP
jgi:serine/threonine-protein kinase